jgi:hypothetical protein
MLLTFATVMLLRDCEPNGIVSINLCIVTFATVMLLRDFGPYWKTFINLCVVTLAILMLVSGFWALRYNVYYYVYSLLPIILDKQFTMII